MTTKERYEAVYEKAMQTGDVQVALNAAQILDALEREEKEGKTE